MKMLFVLVNGGTSSSALTAQVSPAWLTSVAEACTIQLNRDISASYGGNYSVRAGSGPTDVAAGETVFTLVDSLPQAPGAIAFHDVDGSALPFATLALSTCSTLNDVSTAISHELCETAVDVACNAWRDDGNGHEYAQEACDACQEASYDINGVLVSDFLLPAFFAPNAKGPYSFVQSTGGSGPSAPFSTTSGGYQIQRQSGGGETQVTGDLGRRAERAKHFSSRTFRRGLKA